MSKQLRGYIGSILLFIGVFTPIISVPIMGSVTYFNNGHGDGILVALLAIVSATLVWAERYRGLLVTGFLSLGVMAFTMIAFQTRMAEAKAEMETQLAGNPFRGIADMAMQSVQLQWGWAVLVLGAVLVISAGVTNKLSVE